MMLIAFHFVQSEYGPASFGKLLEGATQGDTIHYAREIGIIPPKIAMERRGLRVYRLVQRDGRGRLATAQLHQYGIYRHAIQPG